MTPNIDELFVAVSDKLDDNLIPLTTNKQTLFAFLTLLKIGMVQVTNFPNLLDASVDNFKALVSLLYKESEPTAKAIIEFWKIIDNYQLKIELTEKSHCLSTLSYERQYEYLTQNRRLTIALDELAKLDCDRSYWVEKIGDAVALEMKELTFEEFQQEIAKCDSNFIFFNQQESQ